MQSAMFAIPSALLPLMTRLLLKRCLGVCYTVSMLAQGTLVAGVGVFALVDVCRHGSTRPVAPKAAQLVAPPSGTHAWQATSELNAGVMDYTWRAAQ